MLVREQEIKSKDISKKNKKRERETLGNSLLTFLLKYSDKMTAKSGIHSFTGTNFDRHLILQMKKQRPKEGTWLSQGHSTSLGPESKWPRQVAGDGKAATDSLRS